MEKIIALLIAILLGLSINTGYQIHEQTKRDSMMIAIVNDIGPLGETLCCRKTQLAWMLKSKWVGMPVNNIWGYCDSLKVEYIACTSIEMQLRPKFFEQAVNGETGNYVEFKSSQYHKIFKRIH